MQSITIPFAIQKENSAQEIITRKIPIKLLMAQKLGRSEAEWDLLLDSRDIDEFALLILWLNFNYIIFVLIYLCFILIASLFLEEKIYNQMRLKKLHFWVREIEQNSMIFII